MGVVLVWPVSSKSHLGSYLRESEVKVLVSLLGCI